MKFYTVCTQPRFTSEHVERLYQQLTVYYDGDVDFYCYTDQANTMPAGVNVITIEHNKCVRQWYKTDFFGPNITPQEEPIVVMDLDWTIVGEITDMINTPIERNEFLTVDRWWKGDGACPINGGLYKFYPGSCSHIYKSFYQDPQMWQEKFREGRVVGGEQDFVYVHVRDTHTIKTLDPQKVVRWRLRDMEDGNRVKIEYERLFGKPLMVGEKINSDVVMLHTHW